MWKFQRTKSPFQRFNIMTQIETITYKLPAYWASYLINGDSSGLEESELQTVDSFLQREGEPSFVDCGEQYFSHSNDATTLGGDVCDYVAHVIHHERCATDIDHALRCTCERERIWDLRQEKIQANN